MTPSDADGGAVVNQIDARQVMARVVEHKCGTTLGKAGAAVLNIREWYRT